MAYILDNNKKSIGEQLVPVGSAPTIIVKDNFQITFDGVNPIFQVLSDGTINIGNTNVINNIQLNGNVATNFKRLVDTDMNYFLTSDDYFVEIESPTYTSITLPVALGKEGTNYIISRSNSNPNNNLFILARFGDDIDDRDSLQLRRPGMHIHLVCNGQNSWYVL